jgi:hypothetical protein
MIQGAINNGPVLTTVFQLLNLQIQIALSLNSQDVVSYWQDHMDDWFQPFFALLEFNSALVKGKDDETPSALDDTKTVRATYIFAVTFERSLHCSYGVAICHHLSHIIECIRNDMFIRR